MRYGCGRYGAVAAFGDGWAQIMDTADPAHTTPVSAAFDGTRGAHSSGRGGRHSGVQCGFQKRYIYQYRIAQHHEGSHCCDTGYSCRGAHGGVRDRDGQSWRKYVPVRSRGIHSNNGRHHTVHTPEGREHSRRVRGVHAYDHGRRRVPRRGGRRQLPARVGRDGALQARPGLGTAGSNRRRGPRAYRTWTGPDPAKGRSRSCPPATGCT